jgi:hypothetical protein
MSDPVQPVPVSVVPDSRPTEVVIISHSPLYYWWPVWVVGFLMAAVSYWQGDRIAFVPPGTRAEPGVQVEVERRDGVQVKYKDRDVLIAPEGRSLPAAADPEELDQPRLRMARSNDPGVVWAVTLLLVILITHVKLRGVWSLVVVLLLGFSTVLLAVLGLWDPILQTLRIFDVHVNAFGYLSISLVLFLMWLLMFLVFDRLTYMIFTRGRLRVRKAIGEGEKVFDMRGMVFQRHQDDLFRHWLLGFGTADLTVFTSGANAQQIEMPNVFGIGRKLELINTMLQELEVTKGS